MTEIKVGDTVRIKDNYPFSGEVGKRFVATKIIRGDFDFDYVVMGDQSGYGMWSKYLEKVEADPRWRYNDHIVVYPETRDQQGPGRGVTVLDETPLPKIYTRWENQIYADQTRFDEEITAAARAYWEAHPLPKPAWNKAQAGEVWLLKFREGTLHEGAYVAGDWSFIAADHAIPQDDPRITAGCRIYPEPTE